MAKNVKSITPQQPTDPKQQALNEYLNVCARIGEVSLRIELDALDVEVLKNKAKELLKTLKTFEVKNDQINK